MLKFIFKRILVIIPTLIGITFVSFFVIKLAPGDYASNYKSYLMTYANMSEDKAEESARILRELYGLDKPFFVQYVNWIKGMFEGKLGWSFSYQKDVAELYAERLPRTLVLALIAHLISTGVGILLGIYSATHQYGIVDNTSTVFAFLGTATPRFFLAIVILYGMLFWAGVPEVGGWTSPAYAIEPMSWNKLVDIAMHVWPVVAIAGIGGIARNFRVMRGNLLDILNAQYVTTARSKGLKESGVILRHAVPNAMHPIIMSQGMALPYMLQGELEVSIILSVPTIAPLFYNSIMRQDIYVVGGGLLIYAIILVLGNFLADLLLAAVDPRISFE